MAKTIYTGIAGVARKVKQPYVGVAGVARKVKAGYLGVSGVARQFYQSSKTLGSLSVGTSVYMNVSGTKTEFLVVNQGLPSTSYDSSCNGTWLLMKGLCYSTKWGSNNDYSASNVHSYLNNTFINSLDSGIANQINTVKIPYTNGTGSGGSVLSGANGLSTKIFLPSVAECDTNSNSSGDFSNDVNVEGSALSYLNTNAKRIAYYNGAAGEWWLRSPDTSGTTFTFHVNSQGEVGYRGVAATAYCRPMMIFPSTALVDDSYNIIAA